MTWILTAPKKRVQQFKEATESGKIFSVTFEKKDGTTRTMVARRGVKLSLIHI